MHPFHILFLLFLFVPLLEIYLLIKVGSAIGALPTVLLVVLTAVLGVALLRQQGWYTLRRVQAALGRGELPAIPLLEGVILLVSGALLLTPGFFTDALGFLGLIPAVRHALIRHLVDHTFRPGGGGRRGRHGPAGRSRTIEGECSRDDDTPKY